MDINVYLFIVIALMLLIIMYLLFVLRRVRTQLALIKDALDDIKGGNLNRRILAGENDMTKTICYDINKIAVNSQAQLIRQRQSEQAYKRLMTSLSHDVKTPLASLVGYLEAVENKIVIGEEKDEYIHVAHEKAHYMKSFVENLFEWVKLDSGEQIFHFEKFDLNELSRNIIADWIPVLESNHFEYEFVIPETEYFIHIDVNAYTRVLNNLFQNIIIHSAGDKMALHICEDIQQAKIIISDNGKGIAPDKLPHIFERMYQCDQSRSAKGNGLGLAIAKELISVHKGTITAGVLVPLAMLPVIFLATLAKGYVLPIGAALLYLVPVVLIPSGIMGLHPLASVMGIYPYISSDAAEMVKKWAGGIEITISPNICLISLLVIGSISAIVSVLALRKQTY